MAATSFPEVAAPVGVADFVLADFEAGELLMSDFLLTAIGVILRG